MDPFASPATATDAEMLHNKQRIVGASQRRKQGEWTIMHGETDRQCILFAIP